MFFYYFKVLPPKISLTTRPSKYIGCNFLFLTLVLSRFSINLIIWFFRFFLFLFNFTFLFFSFGARIAFGHLFVKQLDQALGSAQWVVCSGVRSHHTTFWAATSPNLSLLYRVWEEYGLVVTLHKLVLVPEGLLLFYLTQPSWWVLLGYCNIS